MIGFGFCIRNQNAACQWRINASGRIEDFSSHPAKIFTWPKSRNLWSLIGVNMYKIFPIWVENKILCLFSFVFGMIYVAFHTIYAHQVTFTLFSIVTSAWQAATILNEDSSITWAHLCILKINMGNCFFECLLWHHGRMRIFTLLLQKNYADFHPRILGENCTISPHFSVKIPIIYMYAVFFSYSWSTTGVGIMDLLAEVAQCSKI